MYNAHMATDDMLDTSYLFQPRGAGTAWHFRMPTSEVLIGRTNPRTGRLYGREVREGLGSERELRKARKLRDLRLGAVRAEEALALAETNGSLELALTISQELRRIEDPTTREAVQAAISNQAEKLGTRVGERRAPAGTRLPGISARSDFLAFAGECGARPQLYHGHALLGWQGGAQMAAPSGDYAVRWGHAGK